MIMKKQMHKLTKALFHCFNHRNQDQTESIIITFSFRKNQEKLAFKNSSWRLRIMNKFISWKIVTLDNLRLDVLR